MIQASCLNPKPTDKYLNIFEKENEGIHFCNFVFITEEYKYSDVFQQMTTKQKTFCSSFITAIYLSGSISY